MIILTSDQASSVRGVDDPGHALDPIRLADGVTYVLPEDVLTDPAHEDKWAFLENLPRRTVAPSEYLQEGSP